MVTGAAGQRRDRGRLWVTGVASGNRPPDEDRQWVVAQVPGAVALPTRVSAAVKCRRVKR